ncbi:LysR substrate-binding domain-containing protein [Aminobacter aganoensis]|uniref:DNA-binding transcriptional LysR family regulator n=1 Tax=Aminobacter aganoensis TaxID=83264 RepID=A0A7X0KM91_9HYPH|nr:LysR substrate-binding domain-containing protein [Aminobacter aganoensis]MBB6355828.1 DNA-binding transcriptional LysR family regulator [Aminobacter aganoensis]
MHLGELEAFDAVMRMGSTNRAADFLGISQPAISRAIGRLAKSTRLTLFRQVGGRLVPTPEALSLHEEVQRAFVGLDQLRARAAMIREFGAGGLRLACYPALGLSFAPRAIQRYRAKDRSGHVTLLIAGSNAVRDMVASGQADVGLAADEIDASRVSTQPFMSAPAVCVMPAGHRLASYETVAPRDLAGEPFIALSPDDTARRRVERIFEEAGVQARTVVETQYSEVVCNLALEGVGIGIANSMTFKASKFENRGLIARPFHPQIAFRALVLTAKERVKSAQTQALIAALHDTRGQFGIMAAPTAPVDSPSGI